jgi:type II secretory pathway component PulM
MDRNRMLLIGSAVVLVLVIAYMMFGLGGPTVPR